MRCAYPDYIEPRSRNALDHETGYVLVGQEARHSAAITLSCCR